MSVLVAFETITRRKALEPNEERGQPTEGVSCKKGIQDCPSVGRACGSFPMLKVGEDILLIMKKGYRMKRMSKCGR
jgi:hypothetical protein